MNAHLFSMHMTMNLTGKRVTGSKSIFSTVCGIQGTLTLCLLFFVSGKEIIKGLLN